MKFDDWIDKILFNLDVNMKDKAKRYYLKENLKAFVEDCVYIEIVDKNKLIPRIEE